MLVYVATWPRCGNALTRSLLFLNFRLLTANGYASDKPRPDRFRPEYFGDFVRYYQDHRPPYLGLQDNALERLRDNPDLRRDCAALSEVFFVKTHEHPPEDPIDGEAYICMTRHPVRAVASFLKLRPGHDLNSVIEGAYAGGRYDDWHKAWEASDLPNVTVRYEDVITDPALLIRPVSKLIDRPAPDIIQDMPMEASKEKNPDRNPGLLLDGWRDILTDDEVRQVWAELGETASRYGYRELIPAAPAAEEDDVSQEQDERTLSRWRRLFR